MRRVLLILAYAEFEEFLAYAHNSDFPPNPRQIVVFSEYVSRIGIDETMNDVLYMYDVCIVYEEVCNVVCD